MKIVADSSIPFLKGVFEPYGEVVFKPGSEIRKEDLSDTDALIVRTRTRCTADLLEGTPVKIIATPTIGTDHIDLQWCRENGVFVQNAPGCKSGAVMNYFFSALYGAAARKSIPLAGSTLGLIGVGHVGSRIELVARTLGFHVLMCDPPRAEAEGEAQFCSLDYLLENSDVVTLHAPLSPETRRMADADFFSKMKMGAFFINTARGELLDEDALMEAIPRLGPVILDVWNHEPAINQTLMSMVDIATPHIAGYSYQGKQLGTAASVRAVARFFGITELYEFFPETEVKELEAVHLDVSDLSQGQIASLFQYNYPIFTDDFLFRMNPDGFERMRYEYRYRREYYID
ncbi:MAG: 4-phosphoerythronate dehydrogenase [Bacteroidales bacterium]|nr:4-phosphoerythronate dehydrogenase [Bacteroidales bacterium]